MKEPVHSCSFCGRKTLPLVEGPREVFICRRCAELAKVILDLEEVKMRATVWITPEAEKMAKSNMKGKTMKKKLTWQAIMSESTVLEAMPFSVIFRNGKALMGFAKHGTAKANCDPFTDADEVIDGTFAWEPKPAKNAKASPKKSKESKWEKVVKDTRRARKAKR